MLQRRAGGEVRDLTGVRALSETWQRGSVESCGLGGRSKAADYVGDRMSFTSGPHGRRGIRHNPSGNKNQKKLRDQPEGAATQHHCLLISAERGTVLGETVCCVTQQMLLRAAVENEVEPQDADRCGKRGRRDVVRSGQILAAGR